MPVEPLSITAAVIAVTRLTYDSCKSLNDSIKGLRHAPDTLKGLERSLGAFETVTNPLQQDLAGLGDDPDAFSADQQASLRALQPVMHCCRTACDEFAGRLAELTSHSNEGHMSWRDRFRLQFNDSDIRILKENLAQCQQTLGDALGFANLRFANRTQESLDKLASNYAQSINDIGGRIHGLELSMRTLSMSSTTTNRDEVAQGLKVLQEHDQILKKCLQVYQPALKETSDISRTTVKYERAFDKARVAAGNIDFHGEAPATHVESAVARDQSRIFNGNMSAEAANNFWN